MSATSAYPDLAAVLGFTPPSSPTLKREGLLAALGTLPPFPTDPALARGAVRVTDGVEVAELSWWTGYGPRTQAFLLRPAGCTAPLPCVLWLHSHDDVKCVGKEKVVDSGIDGDALPEEAKWVRRDHYGGRAAANALALRGYAVLVHDCFLWGSRQFFPGDFPPRLVEVLGSGDRECLGVMAESISVSKYLSLFGATLAGMLNFDDRVAAFVARRLPETDGSLRVIGLSGGGCRAIYMHATDPLLAGSVCVGAMATYLSMLADHVTPHSWMFWPHGLGKHTDWPGVALIGAPTPLCVQYCAKDALFTPEGMQAADGMLRKAYAEVGGVYVGTFYEEPHAFTVPMQEDAFRWLCALDGKE